MIFIQSYKRSLVLQKMLNKYPCLNTARPGLAVLVLRKDELENYSFWKQDILTTNTKTIAEKKQEIIYTCLRLKIDKALLLDDDLTFGKRREDDITKITTCTDKQVKEMIQLMYSICSEKYPMVHPLIRLMFNNNRYIYPIAKPAIRAVMIHIPTIMQLSLYYIGLKVPFMSDRYMQLSLLNKGYPTIGLGQYCVDDGGTNTKGGCSEYRTIDLQSESAMKLRKAFPGCITLKTKNNGKWNKPRIDCIIGWKKFGFDKFIPKQEMEEFIKNEFK